MSSTNGTTPAYVLRGEFEQLEERVDGLSVTIQRTNAGIGRIEKAQKTQATTLGEHSIALAEIGATLMRIETRLSTHDKVIEEIDTKAERASDTNEHILDQNQKLLTQVIHTANVAVDAGKVAVNAGQVAVDASKVPTEKARDSIQAKADWRKAAIPWLFAGGGLLALLAAAAKACGHDIPTP